MNKMGWFMQAFSPPKKIFSHLLRLQTTPLEFPTRISRTWRNRSNWYDTKSREREREITGADFQFWLQTQDRTKGITQILNGLPLLRRLQILERHILITPARCSTDELPSASRGHAREQGEERELTSDGRPAPERDSSESNWPPASAARPQEAESTGL